ncbi:hypothetical protein EI16_05000 [Hydrogenovibrio marinus]|uniref:Uncharacterized protein n=1 Tax=Hydrogenovibrio marinus TaxID=28885 RepID=A0A066ZZZ9_HYDMR|nr:hypothetical protein EI16_05000 [Hydrogenovibrio marinus]
MLANSANVTSAIADTTYLTWFNAFLSILSPPLSGFWPDSNVVSNKFFMYKKIINKKMATEDKATMVGVEPTPFTANLNSLCLVSF